MSKYLSTTYTNEYPIVSQLLKEKEKEIDYCFVDQFALATMDLCVKNEINFGIFFGLSLGFFGFEVCFFFFFLSLGFFGLSRLFFYHFWIIFIRGEVISPFRNNELKQNQTKPKPNKTKRNLP